MESLRIGGCTVFLEFASATNPDIHDTVARLLIEAYFKRGNRNNETGLMSLSGFDKTTSQS